MTSLAAQRQPLPSKRQRQPVSLCSLPDDVLLELCLKLTWSEFALLRRCGSVTRYLMDNYPGFWRTRYFREFSTAAVPKEIVDGTPSIYLSGHHVARGHLIAARLTYRGILFDRTGVVRPGVERDKNAAFIGCCVTDFCRHNWNVLWLKWAQTRYCNPESWFHHAASYQVETMVTILDYLLPSLHVSANETTSELLKKFLLTARQYAHTYPALPLLKYLTFRASNDGPVVNPAKLAEVTIPHHDPATRQYNFANNFTTYRDGRSLEAPEVGLLHPEVLPTLELLRVICQNQLALINDTPNFIDYGNSTITLLDVITHDAIDIYRRTADGQTRLISDLLHDNGGFPGTIANYTDYCLALEYKAAKITQHFVDNYRFPTLNAMQQCFSSINHERFCTGFPNRHSTNFFYWIQVHPWHPETNVETMFVAGFVALIPNKDWIYKLFLNYDYDRALRTRVYELKFLRHLVPYLQEYLSTRRKAGKYYQVLMARFFAMKRIASGLTYGQCVGEAIVLLHDLFQVLVTLNITPLIIKREHRYNLPALWLKYSSKTDNSLTKVNSLTLMCNSDTYFSIGPGGERSCDWVSYKYTAPKELYFDGTANRGVPNHHIKVPHQPLVLTTYNHEVLLLQAQGMGTWMRLTAHRSYIIPLKYPGAIFVVKIH